MPKMSDTELKALLQAERNSALGGTMVSELSNERAKALDYYNGDMPDMPSQEGRSSAISSDVADTVEGLMPSLIEIFTAGEEAVRFEPVGPEDEEAAKQETDYVNHVFMQKNPGFMVLYTFIKDALLSKTGIVKVYWDKSEKETRETYLDQDDDTAKLLIAQPDVELAEHTMHTDEETGEASHDITLVRRKSYGCAKAVPVPPEEFGISQFARTIKDSKYCFHEPANKTESDLIADGYDEDQVKALPTFSSTNKPEGDSRSTLSEDQSETDAINKASRRIKVIEHYVVMDYEGNGKPGLYRVTTGGNQYEVLRRDGKPDVIAEDVMPFAAMTPVIVTHRFFGKSIADLVMDIQRIKTALLRSYLDNNYMLNNQRVEVAESHAHERTIDDLLVNRPGAIVRTKQPGGIVPIVNQPLGPTILPAIEYMDATREWRTGVTRQGQGLDPSALQNIGENAVLDAANAARAKTKLIARIFAETGIKDMFYLLHGCIRKNDKKANTVRLRNKWVTVDPRQWKERDDMTPNVGLGGGTREQEVGMLGQIMVIQKEMMLGKMPTVTPKNLYNTAAKIVEKIGLKNPEPYFTDPESPEGQQMAMAAAQQPDPEMAKLQAESQLKTQEMQHKAEIEKVQAQADIATQQLKTNSEIHLAERKFELERELKMIDAQLKVQEHQMTAQQKTQEHEQRSQEQAQQANAKAQEASAKAAESKAPKASIEVKHDAQQIMGPLAEVMDKMAAQHAEHTQALIQAVAKASAPKRARKGSDGSWTVEHLQ